MPTMFITDPGKDKPGINLILLPSTADATPPVLTQAAHPNVATETPWFFVEGVSPAGARARQGAVAAVQAALAPLTAVLLAAAEAGALTPAETSQLALLEGWSRRLEVEASLLERELADLGASAP